MTERIETIIPYILMTLTAFYGPNPDILGNINWRHWNIYFQCWFASQNWFSQFYHQWNFTLEVLQNQCSEGFARATKWFLVLYGHHWDCNVCWGDTEKNLFIIWWNEFDILLVFWTCVFRKWTWSDPWISLEEWKLCPKLNKDVHICVLFSSFNIDNWRLVRILKK